MPWTFQSLVYSVKSLQLRNWHLEIHKAITEQSKSKLAIDGCFESISFFHSLSHTCTHRLSCAHTSFSSFFSPLSIPQAQPQECTSPTLSAVYGLRSTWLVPPVLILTNSAEFQRMPDKIIWLRLFHSLVRIHLCSHNQGSVYLLSVSEMFRPECVSTRCFLFQTSGERHDH